MSYDETPTIKGPAMFANRSMQIKMVKDQPTHQAVTTVIIDSDKINHIFRESVKTVVIGTAALAGTMTFLKTASTIAINACPKN